MGSAIFANEIRPVGETTLFFEAVREAANSGPSEGSQVTCLCPFQRMLNGPSQISLKRVASLRGKPPI